MDFWQLYLLVYTLMAFGYLWYRYTFILGQSSKTLGNYYSKVSIIIPFYNERPELLIRTLRGAYNCYGDKEIIVIDDGSTSKECYNELQFITDVPFKLLRYEKNQGKRHAQCIGFEQATGDVIVTLDSDTILKRDAIINLIKPFSNPKIGATTGQLEALNKNVNFLTKLQAARYWNAFNFERMSQSALGVVICCSGPISAYRTSLIKKVMNEFKNQTFMGKPCTFGDDRHLTTLILKRGYNVKFVKEAKGYTDVPETWYKFLKQQIRWKKSWLRETFLVSQFMFKRSGALSFEIMLPTFITFFSIFARIGLIIALIKNPFYILIAIPVLMIMASLHSLYILFNKPQYFIHSVLYGIVHAFVVYWLVFVAAFTFRDIGWGTR